MNSNPMYEVVSLIGTGKHHSTRNWFARCYSKQIGYMEQWGGTELEALKKLEAHIVVQGRNLQRKLKWPPVEQVKTHENRK